MDLKSTLFDIVVERTPFIIDYINNDIEYVKKENLHPPFGSIEFSKYYPEYFELELQALIKQTKITLQQDGNNKHTESEIEAIVRIEAPKQIGYFSQVEYITLFNFVYFGNKTFYFDNKLIEHLAYTKLDAPSELIIPPFDSCLFVLTNPLAIKALHSIDKKNTDLDLDSPISVFIINRPAEKGLRTIVFNCWQASHKSTHIFIKRELLIRKDWSIDQMLQTDWRDIYKEENSKDEILYDESVFYKEGFLFFHILINCILYLGSNEPDIVNVLSNRPDFIRELMDLKSPGKIKYLSRKINSISSLNFNYVGQSVGPITVQKPSDYNEKSTSLNIKVKDKRFIVRGHWRRQHHGESNVETKLIWIRPYFKGPELAQLINKPYNVK